MVGGVARMKYVCACLCLFVSVCVCFSFSAEGEGDHSTGRPENGELLKQAAQHIGPCTHSTQGLTHNTNDHKPPEGQHKS